MTEGIKAKNEIQDLRGQLTNLKNELKDKQLIFENILDSTLAGYWDWNIQDNTEYMSPTFKMMFGYEDHEMENSPEAWQKIIFKEDLPLVFEQFNIHAKSRGRIPFQTEARYRHKNGSTVWVFCRGRIIEWGPNGEPIRMVGCHVDVTRIKKAREIEAYANKLELKNKELEQFAYVASHDLQEPIRTILSFVELLNAEFQEKLNDEGRSYLKFITKASSRMRELVKALLDYSRIGREKPLEPLDLNIMTKIVVSDLDRMIKENNVKIEIDELPYIVGLKVEIQQLFQNLITNSIKFRKKDVQPTIKISVTEKKDFWEFAVKDNGIGFDNKFKDQIFTIFQRLHLRSEYEGTGIGLAHCRKIVELHEGKIWAESEVGVGSTFYFTINKMNNKQ